MVFDLKKYKNFTLLEHTLHHIHNNYHKLYNILWQCLPLFINGFLIMAIYNAPKNAIDLCTERGFVQAGIQTDYNIIFMPASVINLFLIFLRPFMTQMAYARTQKNDRNFYKMLRKIIGGLLVFSLISIIGAYLLGIPVLELIYSRDLVSYRTELIIIMVAGGMNSLATALDNIVTVIRAQHILVFSYLFAWIVVKIISYNIVKEYSLHGAVIVFLIAMLILLITNLFILIVGLKKKKTA